MTTFQRRQSRAIESLLPGQVSYLKKRKECCERDLTRTNIRKGCFDHLVLILSSDKRKAQVEALILTSFGGKSVQEKHPYNRRLRSFHLPIAPTPRHPDNNILLELDGNLRLPKQTYIKTESALTIPWSMLRPYYCDLQCTKLLELKPHSFAQLLKYRDAGFSTEPEIFNSLRADQQGHDDDVQDQGTSGPESVLQLKPVVFLIIVIVVYIILAYLLSLFNKALSSVA